MKTQIPHHLKEYIVDQNYKKYTAEDQAIWRYSLKEIQKVLYKYSDKSAINNMKKMGIILIKFLKSKI